MLRWMAAWPFLPFRSQIHTLATYNSSKSSEIFHASDAEECLHSFKQAAAKASGFVSSQRSFHPLLLAFLLVCPKQMPSLTVRWLPVYLVTSIGQGNDLKMDRRAGGRRWKESGERKIEKEEREKQAEACMVDHTVVSSRLVKRQLTSRARDQGSCPTLPLTSYVFHQENEHDDNNYLIKRLWGLSTKHLHSTYSLLGTVLNAMLFTHSSQLPSEVGVY